MADCLLGVVSLPAQNVVVNPQTNFVVVAGFGDAALGLRTALLSVLLRHLGEPGWIVAQMFAFPLSEFAYFGIQTNPLVFLGQVTRNGPAFNSIPCRESSRM